MELIFQKGLSKLWDAWGINNLTILAIGTFFVVTVTGLLLEAAIVGWNESSLKKLIRPKSSAMIDWIMAATGLLQINRLAGIFMTFGICYYLTGLMQKNIQLGWLSHVHSFALQTILLLLASDFKNYIRHRVFHRVKPLWMVHTMHHSADELTMLTAQRGHFVETAISGFFDVIILMLLGPPLAGFIFVTAAQDFHQLLIHSNIRSDWGWVGRYILVSPSAHRLHHSVESRHYNRNFSSLFIFWDRLFGTYHQKEEIKNVGLEMPGMYRTGFFTQLWTGYKNFWKALLNP